MDVLKVALQVMIALSIVNVWLVRFSKATAWRGGNAKTMREEFVAYGLPGWFMMLIGILKIALAAMLVVGIWFPQLTVPAAAGMALLMLGAIVMHVKIRDPLMKSLPALSMLVLSLGVIVTGRV